MTDSPAPQDPARSRKIFWIKLLSLMALTLLATFVLFRVVASRSLNQRIQAVRDAGYPIEPAELNDWYEMPEGDNAADVYQRAFDAFPHEPDSEGVPIVSSVDNFVLGDPLDPEMAKRIEDYLALHTKSITLLEEAVLIEGCRFPLDMREGYMLLMSHLGKLRQSARLLKLQSILDADRGDFDLAAQRCISIIALARSLENEPIFLASLVNITIHGLAFEQIEVVVNSGQVSGAQLHTLAKSIEPIDLDKMMLRAMVGERCTIHGYFNDSEMLAEQFPFDGAANRISLAVWRTTGLLDIDHSSSLDIMRGYVEFAENPTWPMPAELEDIENSVPRICIVTRMILPALSAAYQATRRAEARRRVVLAGIAVERYRQKHDTFPAQLTDLVPEFLDAVPLDPFDDQPLRYRVEDTGVIIYSIGADSTDNDGQLIGPDGSKNRDGTDIPFTFGGLQEQLWPQPEEEKEDPEY